MTPLILPLLAALACNRDDVVEERTPPPDLVLLTPAPASWHSAGEVSVTGEFNNVRTIEANGESCELTPDGTFSGSVVLQRGINVVEAVGTDAEGEYRFARNGVIAGEFGAPGNPIADAIQLRLNQRGLDKALELVGSFVTQDLVRDAALGMNPVYEDSYGVFGWDAVTISGSVDDITFDPLQLTATPQSGKLELEVVIPDLFVDLQAVGDVIGIDFDVDANLTADRAFITGDLTIKAVNGKLEAEFLDATVELDGFAYDTSLLPGDVEAYLFVDTIRGTIEEMLLEQIQTQVPPLLESTLAGLDLSFDLELLGTPVSVAASFSDASIDSGGVALSTDVEVNVPQEGAPTYSGFLEAPFATPALDMSAHISAAISDDLLNNLLFELWRGGLLKMELSTDDGSMEPYMLIPLKAEEGSITLDALLPPVIVQAHDGLQLQLGEAFVVIETPGGELGEYMELSVSAFMPVEIVVDGVELKMELGDPDLHMMVRESDWGASDTTVTQVLEEMLPISTLLALVGDIAFPLPSLYGLEIDSAEVGRDAGGSHVSATVEIR